MIRAYKLIQNGLEPLSISTISFDELTRDLPRGLYSTFITNHQGTRVLGLTAHLDRLYLARDRAVPASASRADLRRALAFLASENAPGESRLRVLLTDLDGTVYIFIQPFTPLPREIYERGVNVVTVNQTRHSPRLKDTGFIVESQSTRAKVGGDIFEALLTKGGRIYEGMTSNFYAVMITGSGAALVTAQKGILLGVTRRAVLRLARQQGFNIDYRPPRLDEEFAEAFLTSSSRGVVPIVSIDGKRAGDGKPGPWTNALSSAYQIYVEERSEQL